MNNAPKIRFLGFEDEWENKILGKIAEYSKGQGYSKNDLTEEGNPIILYGRLYTNYESTISEADTYTTPKPGSVFSSGREVIIPASGETAEDIARASYVKQQGVILGGDLNILTPEDGINPGFLALAISNGKTQEGLSIRAQGKTVVHIHNDDIKEVCVSLPLDQKEQARIAQCFSQIDQQIECQQRKCEKLIALKAACLDKMFPKRGSKVPELRFAGFSGDWEPKKLGDVAISFDYGLNAAAKEFDGVNKYLRITDIDDSTRVFRDDDLTSPNTDLSSAGNYLLHEGEILFARTGASVGKTYIYKETDGLVFFAGFLIRAKIKSEYDAEFVFQNTLGEAYDRYIQVTSQRSGQPGVNAQEYAEYSFLLPTYSEQKRIGIFLQQIDNLIVLHQRKLGKLQQFKQAMMHNMFV